MLILSSAWSFCSWSSLLHFFFYSLCSSAAEFIWFFLITSIFWLNFCFCSYIIFWFYWIAYVCLLVSGWATLNHTYKKLLEFFLGNIYVSISMCFIIGNVCFILLMSCFPDFFVLCRIALAFALLKQWIAVQDFTDWLWSERTFTCSWAWVSDWMGYGWVLFMDPRGTR